MGTFNTIPHFKFWCQKVLPLVYDDSLSYMELLAKVVNYLNHVIDDVNQIPDFVKEYIDETHLEKYVDEILDIIRVQIARIDEHDNTTATANRHVGELVWLDNNLALIVRDMNAGDRYVEETGEVGVTGNFVYTSVEIEMNKIKDDMSSEINSLSEDVATSMSELNESINSTVNSLSTDISVETSERASYDNSLTIALSEETSTRQSQDSSLSEAIGNEASTRSSADTALGNRVSTLEGSLLNPPRKFIMVGDSYAVGSYGHTGWIDLVNELLGLTRGVTSFDSRDVSVYFGGSFSAGTFKTQLIDCLTLIDDPNKITDICVFAGQNEHAGGTIAQMETNFDDFCNYAYTHYPNAKIHVGFIGRGSDYTLFNQMEERTREYIKLAGRNKCHYVTNIEYVNRLYSLYTEDTIHPNDYTDMANYIAEGIINGSVDVKRSRSYTIDATDHGSGTISLSFKQNNGVISCTVNLNSLTTNTEITGGSSYTNGITLGSLGQIDLLAGLVELNPLYVVSRNSNAEEAGSTYANMPVIQLSLVRSNTVDKIYARCPMTISTGWYNLPTSSSISITGKRETIIDASLN